MRTYSQNSFENCKHTLKSITWNKFEIAKQGVFCNIHLKIEFKDNVEVEVNVSNSN